MNCFPKAFLMCLVLICVPCSTFAQGSEGSWSAYIPGLSKHSGDTYTKRKVTKEYNEQNWGLGVGYTWNEDLWFEGAKPYAGGFCFRDSFDENSCMALAGLRHSFALTDNSTFELSTYAFVMDHTNGTLYGPWWALGYRISDWALEYTVIPSLGNTFGFEFKGAPVHFVWLRYNF